MCKLLANDARRKVLMEDKISNYYNDVSGVVKHVTVLHVWLQLTIVYKCGDIRMLVCFN